MPLACQVVWIGLVLILSLSNVDAMDTDSDQQDTEAVGTDTCNADGDGSEPCDADADAASDVVLDHNEYIWTMPKTYDCENERNERDCQYWKTETNACENTPGFMVFACPKSCGFCHLKDPKIRCQRHPNAKPAVVAGDVDKMFERLLTDFPEYEPTVYSREPWVVVLKNVYTDEECDRLVKIGGRTFRRSVDAGAMQGDDAQFQEIVSDARTSQTAWCVNGCWEDPVINGIAQKAENITLIPKENSEYFQVLKYEVGQYYVQHHDYIRGHLDLPIGPRVYTYFIYLNTPEKGGGTKFNKLGFTIPATKGSVAIWPSVLDKDPYKKEWRTNHEAVPVEEGVKYGANMWLHMYNFHDPYKITCTG
mmetsp:Transcript_21779/g.34969  ORF Transcript_21779/g.34969 Transcript_21779/m.34969 type:complete len:364 (-) Transcript_21779:177-1268(-)